MVVVAPAARGCSLGSRSPAATGGLAWQRPPMGLHSHGGREIVRELERERARGRKRKGLERERVWERESLIIRERENLMGGYGGGLCRWWNCPEKGRREGKRKEKEKVLK